MSSVSDFVVSVGSISFDIFLFLYVLKYEAEISRGNFSTKSDFKACWIFWHSYTVFFIGDDHTCLTF